MEMVERPRTSPKINTGLDASLNISASHSGRSIDSVSFSKPTSNGS